MHTPTQKNNLIAQVQGNLAAIFVVAIGYVVSFAAAAVDNDLYSPLEITFSVLAGVVYTFFCIQDGWLRNLFPVKWQIVLYFAIQLALSGVIVTIIRPGAIWLIFMPLVGQSVELLTPRWRWLLYGFVMAGLSLPIGLRTGDWNAAVFSALTFSPAILFVVTFTRLRLDEENARKRAEQLTADLEQANRQLAAYATQIEELAITQERNRLAREIHDNLGHYLTVVNVQIEAARLLMEGQPERAQDALAKAQRLTQEGLTAVRQSVSTLRESPIENKPLSEALSALVQESQTAGILTNLQVQGVPHSLDAKTALTLYRTAQEALTNVRKHARASQVNLVLDYQQAGVVRLTVHDNGVGTAVPSGGFGLLGLRERVQQLGGEVELKTAPGDGFLLTVAVPG